MAKKAAKKRTKKPVDGNDLNALGLEGPGVAVIRIAAVTRAINEYEVIKNERCLLTPKEVKAKTRVIEVMTEHEEELRNPQTGNLVYHLEDGRFVEIEPARVKIKFRDEPKPKKKKGSDDDGDMEPEEQEALDQQD